MQIADNHTTSATKRQKKKKQPTSVWATVVIFLNEPKKGRLAEMIERACGLAPAGISHEPL